MLFFFILFLRLCPSIGCASLEEDSLAKGFTLTKIYETQLSLPEMERKVKSLKEKGYCEKRCYELFALGVIKKYFSCRRHLITLGDLVVSEDIGGSFSVKFHKQEGVIDEMFLPRNILEDFDRPMVYNQIHVVKFKSTFQPADLTTLQKTMTFSEPYMGWDFLVKKDLTRACGTVTFGVPFLWAKEFSALSARLKSYVTQGFFENTLTALNEQGVLTLYKVVKDHQNP